MSVAKIVERIQERLEKFEFQPLFVDVLGWAYPKDDDWKKLPEDIGRYRVLAEMGVQVLEVEAKEGVVPESDERLRIHRLLTPLHQEHILVFVDGSRSQSLWSWTKGSGTKTKLREHAYFKGSQSLDFVSKLAELVIGIEEVGDEGKLNLIEASKRVARAFDVQEVTKRFYEDYDRERLELSKRIRATHRESGREMTEKERNWYVSVILNRLLFIYFLQKRMFLNHGDADYLEKKLANSKEVGKDRFYRDFLQALFFDAFAKPDNPAEAITGKIPYLNGGLFLPHELEQDFEIEVEDEAFDKLFGLFHNYNWAFFREPDQPDRTISPDVLGYIFEKYVNQKEFGAYYTRPEITRYLCRQTIHQVILDKVETLTSKRYRSVAEVAFHADARLCLALLSDVLPSIRLIDPACGSGAFLVAALETLYAVWESVVGRARVIDEPSLNAWIKDKLEGHRSDKYQILKTIITSNIYGVDLMPEACEIARLRLFMALVASVDEPGKLEPLPNIDFNIMAGNGLIGLMGVEDKELEAQGSLFAQGYPDLVTKMNNLVHRFNKTEDTGESPQEIKDKIEALKDEARPVLDEIQLERFHQRGVKFEQATWDLSKERQGKPIKRAVTIEDIRALQPFHWAFEFNEAMQAGGFDAIMTNPPWVVWETSEKEFFRTYDATISKNKIRIEEWEDRKNEFLSIPEVRAAWLEYESSFPHVSAYFKSAPEFRNQISYVDGRNVGSKPTLQGLFTEQCFNILRPDGLCGIVLPSGIYTDVGPKALRQLLFESTEVTGLFGFENRKEIFENVHRSFKPFVLSFRKGGVTNSFPAVFMRHEVGELERFPEEMGFRITREFISTTTPRTLSLLEIKNGIEYNIALKFTDLPFLGSDGEGPWNLALGTQLNMTTHKDLFRPSSSSSRAPLYQGRMIHQFLHTVEAPTRWVEIEQGKRVAGADWQRYRLAYRSIARSTDSRTMIAAILPAKCFFGHSLNAIVTDLPASSLAYLLACLNSFVSDFYLRLAVSANVTMPFIHQLKIPKVDHKPALAQEIIQRSTRLVCTTPEFDDFAKEVGLGSHKNGATDPTERAKLRAELDGMIAHLYGLTEGEFAHVLSTFPLVKQEVRDAAMAEYRRLATKMREAADNPTSVALIELIQGGESAKVEFKETLEHVDPTSPKIAGVPDPQRAQKLAETKRDVLHSSLKTICGFLNAQGGTLLIGVHDDKTVIGIERDLKEIKGQSLDGFELKLRAQLKSRFHPVPDEEVQVSFASVEGKTICRVDVASGHADFFLDDEFFLRVGNQTEVKKGAELAALLQKRIHKRSSASAPEIEVTTPKPDCTHPRRVMDGHEDGIFHVSPFRLDSRNRGGSDPETAVAFYAPFPYRIAGLRKWEVEDAGEERKVIVLGKLKNQTNDGEGGLMTYQFLRLTDPEPGDLPCFEPD